MCDRRKVLLVLTAALAIFALVNIAYVSSSVLQPSDRAKSERSVHTISTLENGDYRFDPYGRGSEWKNTVMVLKDWDGVVYAYLIPTNNGTVPMPDRFWGWSWHDCIDFRPETIDIGKIKEGGVIKCHDPDKKHVSMSNWEWSYDGVPKYAWLPKLYAPPTEVVGNKIFINK